MNLTARSLLTLLALLPLSSAAAGRIDHRELRASDSCYESLSNEDAAAGLGAVFDATCSQALTPDIDLTSNAVDKMFGDASALDRGCFSRSCRYCQSYMTSRSSRYSPCDSASPSVSSERRLASDDVSAQCAALAAQTTLVNVSFVIEAACNVSGVAMDGCVPLTPCQLCRQAKTELNAFLISCDVLNGWKLRAQQQQTHQPQEQVTVTTTAVKADELGFQGETGTANTSPSSSTSSSATSSLSPVEAVAAVGVALVALVGGVFIVKHHRQRRMEEDELGTPKDNGGMLVSVQSRTQIATI